MKHLFWSSIRRISTRASYSARYNHISSLPFSVEEEVSNALQSGKPVVALESAIITHGMPYPLNRDTALRCEGIIRSTGAIPATIGMLSGQIHIGLTGKQIDRLADESNPNKAKLSRRDIAPAIAKKTDGGTTIAGTMILAHLAGIKVFSTGGLGGVHRGGENSMDISADLTELGRTPVAVVSAGVKSILDIGRTLEYLETQGVTVVTYGEQRDFPAFFSRSSGCQSPYSVHSPRIAAEMLYASHQLRLQSGALIACPIPEEFEAEGLIIQEAVNQAVRESEENGMSRSGKDATPWLLKRVTELTQRNSLKNNVALIENTSRIGGEIAVEYANLLSGSPLHHLDPVLLQPKSSAGIFSVGTARAPAELIVVGAAAVDVIAQADPSSLSDNHLISASTVPGTVGMSLGGVARNIAEAAHRTLLSLGNSDASPRTLLVAPLGDDSFGGIIQQGTESIGMRSDGLLVTTAPGRQTAIGRAERRSPVCNMVLSRSGDLIGGVADFTALDTLRSSELIPILTQQTPQIVALDGNIPESALCEVVSYCVDRGVPVWFEPTSKAKSTRVIPALRTTLAQSERAPITYTSPNTLELEKIFERVREPSVQQDKELPALTSSDQWFERVDRLGLQAGALSDAFARLGGPQGSFLSQTGIIQMSVQLLPFFQHLIVKCADKGVFIAMQIHPNATDREAWLAASSTPRHSQRPIVHSQSDGGLLVLKWYEAHTLEGPVVNVTGAGDSLVGSLLGSITHGGMSKDPFHHPSRLDSAIQRAQNAAVRSLQSSFAVARDLSGKPSNFG